MTPRRGIAPASAPASAPPAGPGSATVLPPLAGLDVRDFLTHYWQRRPLLIRAALPAESLATMFPTRDLFSLARDPDVESRLIRAPSSASPSPTPAIGGRTAARSWRLRHGPFSRLPRRAEPGWTVLVQGVDLHRAAGRQLMDRFRFIPDARIDDLMISHASDSGGVGPHADSYDVFLLQAHGRRRWRIAPPGPARPARLVPNQPLKLLADFEPTEQWLLAPGDMLYLPPGWGHDGIAFGECMTCSIGFRAPAPDELRRAFFASLADADDADPAGSGSIRRRADTRYRDRAGTLTGRAASHPAEIPADMASTLAGWLRGWRPGNRQIDDFIGRHLTEPKPTVWFEPGGPAAGRPIRLDRRTRMLYRREAVYINGEALRPPRAALALLQSLADQRALDAAQAAVARRNAWLRDKLQDWLTAGWLRDADD